MHGNVHEWVQDCAHDSYQGAPEDGQAWLEASYCLRVLRGGYWFGSHEVLRSALRGGNHGGPKAPVFGFRVVCPSNLPALTTAGNAQAAGGASIPFITLSQKRSFLKLPCPEYFSAEPASQSVSGGRQRPIDHYEYFTH